MVVAEVCSSMKYPKRCQYKHAKQKKYHVRNWAEYNEGLRRRGDLTVWFDEEAIANWKADKTGKPGGQRVYSDMAIETGLVVRMVYKLAYRQTEGFLHSIASLLGLGIEIPDYSTLCRRSRLLRKKLRIPKAASTQPIHLMIDSTGLRIHVGTARKPPKLRAWRKLHIAVDRETGNIVASELTASRARDATRVPALLTQIQAPLVSVAADSCAPQKIDPALIARSRPATFDCFWLIFFFADHSGPEDVEFATLEWVHWYNTQRLLEPIGNVSPVEYEMNYYRSQEGSLEMARLN